MNNTPPYAADNLLMGDALHAAKMADGSTRLLNAIRHLQGSNYDPFYLPGPKLQWHKTGQLAGTGARSAMESARAEKCMAIIREQHDFVESLRTSRDACTYCGVRGDIGCKHRRAA